MSLECTLLAFLVASACRLTIPAICSYRARPAPEGTSAVLRPVVPLCRLLVFPPYFILFYFVQLVAIQAVTNYLKISRFFPPRNIVNKDKNTDFD